MATNSSQESSQKEALKMLSKYPGRLPVICLQGAAGSSMAELLPDQKKFLVPSELLCDGFKDIIRKHIRERTKVDIRSDFQLFAGSACIDGQMTMQEAYEQHKAENCFLYVSCALGDGDRIALEGKQRQSGGMSSDARKLLAKHPNNVPVVCARAEGSDAPTIGKNRFLVPCSMPCSEFKATLQKQFSEPAVGNPDAIQLSVGDQFLDGSLSMEHHYDRHGAPDGFLYVSYDLARVGQISSEPAQVAEEAEDVSRTQDEQEKEKDACANMVGHASCETEPVEQSVEEGVVESSEMVAEQQEVEKIPAKVANNEIGKCAAGIECASCETEPVELLVKEPLAETIGANAEVDDKQEDAGLNVEPKSADGERRKGANVFEHASHETEPIELSSEEVPSESTQPVSERCAEEGTHREDTAQDEKDNPANEVDVDQDRAMKDASVLNVSDESEGRVVAGDGRIVCDTEASGKGTKIQHSGTVHLPDNDPETLEDVSAVGRTCSSSPATLSPFWQRDDDTRNTLEPGTGGTQSMQNVPSGRQGPMKRHSTGSPDVSAEPSKNTVDDGSKIMSKFPGRVPVLCKKGAVDAPDISRSKFLVPAGMLCSEFKYLIYKQLTRGNGLGVTDTIYLFVTKDVSPKSCVTMGELHAKYKADDSFLHITYSVENTLGYSLAW